MSLSRSRWYAEKMGFVERHGPGNYLGYPRIGWRIHKGVAQKPQGMSWWAMWYHFQPRAWIWHMGRRITAEKVPMDILRKQILAARFEYWGRKVRSVPLVWETAKREAAYLTGKLKDPLSMTGNDLLWFVALGINCYGTFIIGEMLGRRSLWGYGVVPAEWQPSRGSFHFHPTTW